MSRGRYGYGQFKQKQNMEVYKYKATVKYNSIFNKMLSDIHDLYIDFSFNLYEELLSLDSSKDLFFEKVCDIIKSASYEKSKDLVSDYVNSTDIDNCKEINTCNDLLSIVFDVYFEEILDYYNIVCNDYLISILKSKSEWLSKEDCFRELACLDSNFIRMSVHRFNSLFEKVKVSSAYLNDIFMEECTINIAIKLKDVIINTLITILKELYNTIDFSESELNEIFNLLNSEGDSTKNKYSNKLEYIDDYKKLNKLAIDSGFEYVRCKGDHGIYKNENGLVVIPQGRTIGKGLSIKIQKAIVSLSEASA